MLPGAGGAAIGIVEASYRSRLLFLSLKATVNHPDPIAWGHHIFLRVAAPLSAGVYNVTASAAAFGQAFTVQLLVDEDKVLNENIHVNQVSWWMMVMLCVCVHSAAHGAAVYLSFDPTVPARHRAGLLVSLQLC